jgi:hypothetical protein
MTQILSSNWVLSDDSVFSLGKGDRSKFMDLGLIICMQSLQFMCCPLCSSPEVAEENCSKVGFETILGFEVEARQYLQEVFLDLCKAICS